MTINLQWIAVKIGSDIQVPNRINFNHFSVSVIFHQVNVSLYLPLWLMTLKISPARLCMKQMWTFLLADVHSTSLVTWPLSALELHAFLITNLCFFWNIPTLQKLPAKLARISVNSSDMSQTSRQGSLLAMRYVSTAMNQKAISSLQSVHYYDVRANQFIVLVRLKPDMKTC